MKKRTQKRRNYVWKKLHKKGVTGKGTIWGEALYRKSIT